MKYYSYIEIAENLEINKGSVVLLSSDVSRMSFEALENGSRFNADEFLNIIINKIGESGTLLLPTYNWGFCHGEPFDYGKTIGKTGYLGNAALKRSDFKRTKNPIYSFVVWGHDKDYLCNIDNIFCFGKNTVFDYLVQNNALSVAIDVEFNNYYTICHHAEQLIGVNYRYNKYFKGTYIDENNVVSKSTSVMNVRNIELDIIGEANQLYSEFLYENIAYEKHFDNHIVSYIDMAKSMPIMDKDILYNQSRKQVIYGREDLLKYNNDNRMYSIVSELFPITRSLSGNGNRQTLNYIKTNHLGELNIKEYSIKDNPYTFDWKTPFEWNIYEAYIEDENGEKIIDIKNNNLHILGYSESIDSVMAFSELDNHLYSLEDDIDAIPYTTSYYKTRWGFCLTHRKREELRKHPDKLYHVVIKSDFNENGSITYGELIINGESDEEILISTYICHPSMANDNLSGVALACEIAKYIYALPTRRYTYRIIFIPETIGALIYLKENITHMQEYIKAGFVLSCIGDEGDYSCVHSPYNNTYTDKIVTHVLKHIKGPAKEYSFLERGSDERQFAAPLVNLPVCTLSRTKFGKFKEYHTSHDNLNYVTPLGLAGGFNYLKICIDILENNKYYKIKTVGEPQLGKYGLYPTISQKGSADYTRNMTNIIAYLNGENSLLEIADILNIPFNKVLEIVIKLNENNLLDEI